jgi:hypothetical protein
MPLAFSVRSGFKILMFQAHGTLAEPQSRRKSAFLHQREAELRSEARREPTTHRKRTALQQHTASVLILQILEA